MAKNLVSTCVYSVNAIVMGHLDFYIIKAWGNEYDMIGITDDD